MTFTFRQGPAGTALSDDVFVRSALDQPLSLGSTFFDQAAGGVLASPGLGTAIRSSQLPEEAPTEEGIVYAPPDAEGQTATAPDTPQMRARIGIVQRSREDDLGLRQETGLELQRRRDEAGALSEDAYKASPSFRTDIPWDPGMTKARAEALAAQDDVRKVREFYAQKRPVTSFFGALAGQAVDPINYIPVFGEAVQAAAIARAGAIGGRALAASADAAASTAFTGLLTAPTRASLGDDVSWQAQVTDIAFGALIGGAFGSIGGVLTKRKGDAAARQIDARLDTLQRTQEARVVLNDAIDGMVRDGQVRVSDAGAMFVEKAQIEATELSRAYDNVLANPTGPVDDPLVRIEPGDIDALLVSRGAFRNINEVEFSKSGSGLVKVIWQHGEQSGKAAERRVTKDDIVALPNVVREYEPIPPEGARLEADAPARTWRVERDGRLVTYGDKGFDGAQRLVTVHVTPREVNGVQAVVSERKSAVSPGSQPPVLSRTEDTAGDLSLGDPGAGRDRTATQKIRQPQALDKSAPAEVNDPAVQAAGSRAAKPGTATDFAKSMGVDPTTGEFAERAELDQLIAEGRVSEDAIADLQAADEDYTTATAWGEALKTAMGCTI